MGHHAAREISQPSDKGQQLHFNGISSIFAGQRFLQRGTPPICSRQRGSRYVNLSKRTHLTAGEIMSTQKRGPEQGKHEQKHVRYLARNPDPRRLEPLKARRAASDDSSPAQLAATMRRRSAPGWTLVQTARGDSFPVLTRAPIIYIMSTSVRKGVPRMHRTPADLHSAAEGAA